MRRLTRYLRIRAPFAQFRCFSFGGFRGSYTFPPPSTARGLLMSAAGLEMHEEPAVSFAVGRLLEPGVGVLLQQVHAYHSQQVTRAQKDANGSVLKPAVKLARVEVLMGLDLLLGLRADEAFLARLEAGIRGEVGWGVPFAGANDFPVSHLDLYEALPDHLAARWLVADAAAHDRQRLPVRTNHAEPTESATDWFALGPPSTTPPEAAWLT